MYSGLEVRVPFCDYRIAEYLYSVPWEFKDYRSYEKGLLREAMKDYLPDEYAKIAACQVAQNGNYVSLIVSPDAEAMTKQYQAAFK